MAGYLWMTLFVGVATISTRVSGDTPRSVYVDDYCLPAGEVISFSGNIILGYSRYKSYFPANYRCEVAIESENRNNSRLQMSFLDLDMLRSATCVRAGLAIFEGTTYLTPANGVCGTTAPATRYRTKGNRVFILVTNKAQSSFYGDFKILLTSVYTAVNGSCFGDDFACDNGICLSSQLTCNGYNNCGDHSDEGDCSQSSSADTVVIIVFTVGSILATSIFCAVIRARWRKYCKPKPKVVRRVWVIEEV